MDICKGTVFALGKKRVIAMSDMHISEQDRGYFILNFWEQCSYREIDVLPVAFVRCEDEKELYTLKKDNIILGSEKDICLI